jgi:hypothetical protein
MRTDFHATILVGIIKLTKFLPPWFCGGNFLSYHKVALSPKGKSRETTLTLAGSQLKYEEINLG